MVATNADKHVVAGFGDEWSRFDQSGVEEDELRALFNEYFSIVPWDRIPENAIAFDAGCGSGRWASLVAQRVGVLHCVDASDAALAVAKRNLARMNNCEFHLASIDSMPIPDQSADFGYSLGVLHHLPDTDAGLAACISKLKPGAIFLLYLYYALDNRPTWYRVLWCASEVARRLCSRLPLGLRSFMCQLVALVVYWPLARLGALLEFIGANVRNFPLASYRRRSLYVMRNDALDRLGTRIEHRFTREQIQSMLLIHGMTEIRFSENAPYWCVVSVKG